MDRIIYNEHWARVYGAALLFSLIVGFSFLFAKTAVTVATPLQTLVYRFTFAFLAIYLVEVSMKDRKPISNLVRRKLAVNAMFYLGFMVFQVVGLLYSSSLESGIIFAAIPILAKIIARFALGETSSFRQNFFVILSVAGVMAMVVGSTNSAPGENNFNLLGLILLILSSLSMAASNVYTRYVRAECSPFRISFYIAALGCLVFHGAAITAGLIDGDLIGYYLSPLQQPKFLVATLYLGIPSTVISAMLMAYMMGHMTAVKATIFGNLSTLISILAGAFFLQEPLQFYHLVCTGLILAGVIGTSLTTSAVRARH